MKNLFLLFLSLTTFMISNAQKSFGFTYQNNGKEIIIMKVYKNGPAEKAGILVGDIILSVGDISAVGININETPKLFSEAKDVCVITVKRNGTITKDLKIIKEDKAGFFNVCIFGNCQNGKSVFIDVNGNEYNGDFINGKITGFGKMEYAAGSVYTGYFLNGNPEGKGKEVFTNGSYYEGNYFNGLYNGQGLFTSGNGDTYNGSFKKGMPDSTITHFIKSSNETFIEIYKHGVLASSKKVEKNIQTNTLSDAKEAVLNAYYTAKKDEIVLIERNFQEKKLYKERLELYKQTLKIQNELVQFLTDAVNGTDLSENAKWRVRQTIEKEKKAVLQTENLVKVTGDAAKNDK